MIKKPIIQKKPCPCACKTSSLRPIQVLPSNSITSSTEKRTSQANWNFRYFVAITTIAAIWVFAYLQILPLSQWISYDFLGLQENARLGAAVQFFLYDSAKILLLLVGMIYLIAWLRASLNLEKLRAFLAGKGRAAGYFIGAAFGAITPFCSCSSIPLFLGFCSARIPIGVSMAFIITSPLINEVGIVLLWGILGWKFTLVYVLAGMLAGIGGGILMDALKAQRWLTPLVQENLRTTGAIEDENLEQKLLIEGKKNRLGIKQRHAFAWFETSLILKKIWIWVIIGVGAGAALHGYVPENWFSQNLGSGQWWSVPAAVALGIPLYTNVTGIVPVMQSLLAKGLPIGTTLAFCMSTVAASLPEILMLKQVMQWKILAVFIAYLLFLFTLLGWFFNLTGDYFF